MRLHDFRYPLWACCWSWTRNRIVQAIARPANLNAMYLVLDTT
jgi:hypothetical protein